MRVTAMAQRRLDIKQNCVGSVLVCRIGDVQTHPVIEIHKIWYS